MPEPFAKVTIGDQVRFTAQWYNAVTDAAKAYQQRGALGAKSLVQTRSSTIIRVRNDTGNDLPRNSVVGLNGPIFLPTDSEDAFLREVTFSAVTPDASKHKRRYAVLLESSFGGTGYGDNHVCRAYLAGICQVQVDLIDVSHEYANIIDADTTHLKSSRFGHARILWSESDDPYSGYTTGIQWCIVMLGVTGSCEAIGKANGGITARSGTTYGTGSVDLYRSNAGSEDGPIETISVLNAAVDSGGISSGKYCAVVWDADDVAWVSPIEC